METKMADCIQRALFGVFVFEGFLVALRESLFILLTRKISRWFMFHVIQVGDFIYLFFFFFKQITITLKQYLRSIRSTEKHAFVVFYLDFRNAC